jgi:hypothetical protein
MKESGELADLLAQSLVRPEIVHQLNHFANHQEGVAIARVAAARLERRPDRREALLGERTENEVERGGARRFHAEA